MVSDSTESDGNNQIAREQSTMPDVFSARIAVTRESFAHLLRTFSLDLGCRPHVDKNEGDTGTLVVYATEERLREIQAAGYTVEQGDNVSALGRERQAEVGKGDRFEGGRIPPSGLGKKPEHGRTGGSQ